MSRFVEISFLLLGLLGVYFGVSDLGFWVGITPGGGFLPALTGGMLVLLSVFLLLNRGKKSEGQFDIKVLYPIVAVLAAIAVSYLIGMLPAIALMVFFWLKKVEKYSLVTSLKASVIIIVFTYAIFKVWLRVPFPVGVIGRL